MRLSLIRIIMISAVMLTLGCSVSETYAQPHDSQVLLSVNTAT